jgi:DUF971 family protein
MTVSEIPLSGTERWPEDIQYVSNEKTLVLKFDNGETFRLPAEYLRVESPSAEVQGHAEEERKTIPGRRHVGIMGIEQMGNYAIKINFDDLHDTGIFSWTYLYKLGREQDAIWNNYLSELVKQGLSRDP